MLIANYNEHENTLTNRKQKIMQILECSKRVFKSVYQKTIILKIFLKDFKKISLTRHFNLL